MLPPGYYHLIRELLLLTKSDLKIRAKKKGPYYRYKQEALAFIEREWFEALCVAVSLDPDAVRRELLNPRNSNQQS